MHVHKINLKQSALARLFFFVIYYIKFPFMHPSWGKEGVRLLTLRDSNILSDILLPGGDVETE